MPFTIKIGEGMEIEKKILDLYKSVNINTMKKIIPFIDFTRKLNKKPPIPLKEKLCLIPIEDFSSNKVIMLHGVSVGEVLSLDNLIKKIKENFPSHKLVLTTGTLTGQELAHKKYDKLCDYITYFPLDIYEAVDKFLSKINPRVILIAETELWPNFALCAKEKNIPLYIINGRISDKSYPSYLKFRKFFEMILNFYTGIFCQSELDKKRFIDLGARKESVEVMKNLKFEIEKKSSDIDLFSQNSKVLIAASTHKGEDEVVLRAYKKLKSKIKNLKLIIAPRHLTRVDDVYKLTKNYNFKTGFRTKNDNFSLNDIIILDTLGELSKVYSIADVAFIGGSFNKTGGHNPLEATIYSKPAVSGPSIKNFRDIYSLLERDKAAFVVKNEREFYEILEKLLSDDVFYKTITHNCLNSFKSQQGAVDFVINKLGDILNN